TPLRRNCSSRQVHRDSCDRARVGTGWHRGGGLLARYDLAVTGGTVVIPFRGAVRTDIGVRDGRIVAIEDGIAPRDADDVVDARGKLVFPGGVDGHFHIGIYRPVSEDAQ